MPIRQCSPSEQYKKCSFIEIHSGLKIKPNVHPLVNRLHDKSNRLESVLMLSLCENRLPFLFTHIFVIVF